MKDVYANESDLMRLETKCGKLILDCIDWTTADGAKVSELYDLLFSVYCAKLTQEGQPLESEQALRTFIDTYR